MRYRKGKHVVKRFDNSEIGAVGSLLKAYKLLHSLCLAAYTPYHARHLDDIGIAEIGLDAYLGVNSLAKITEQYRIIIGKLAKEARHYSRQSLT